MASRSGFRFVARGFPINSDCSTYGWTIASVIHRGDSGQEVVVRIGTRCVQRLLGRCRTYRIHRVTPFAELRHPQTSQSSAWYDSSHWLAVMNIYVWQTTEMCDLCSRHPALLIYIYYIGRIDQQHVSAFVRSFVCLFVCLFVRVRCAEHEWAVSAYNEFFTCGITQHRSPARMHIVVRCKGTFIAPVSRPAPRRLNLDSTDKNKHRHIVRAFIGRGKSLFWLIEILWDTPIQSAKGQRLLTLPITFLEYIYVYIYIYIYIYARCHILPKCCVWSKAG